MAKFRLVVLFLFSAFGIIFYSGCASTSSSIRYHNSTDKPDEKNSTVRFGAKEDTSSNKFNEAANDTSNTYDITTDTDPDDLPANEKKIDISTILKRYTQKDKGSDISPGVTSVREKILMEIIKYLDTPYKYGGSSKNGIDCSAFTQAVYSRSLSIPLERSARDQFQMGDVIGEREDLQFGDLVFFNTRRRVKPGHVGIYIGDNLFAHSSSKYGVIVSSLDDDYYSNRFMGGRRIGADLGTVGASKSK
jgi:cell wall-associated NlpC family hydrolase